MIDPLKTEPVIKKLLEKTRAGRVEWEKGNRGYRCSLDDEYYFNISRVEDSFLFSMGDKMGDEIFQETAQEEIFYRDPGAQERVELFRDLYELARRKAVGAEGKIDNAMSSLDRI